MQEGLLIEKHVALIKCLCDVHGKRWTVVRREDMLELNLGLELRVPERNE